MATVLIDGVEHDGVLELHVNDIGNLSIVDVKLSPAEVKKSPDKAPAPAAPPKAPLSFSAPGQSAPPEKQEPAPDKAATP